MWSKESDSTVNNKLAYFMTQSASLQLLDLPAFVQDTQVDTKVREKTIIYICVELNFDFFYRSVWICLIMWTLVGTKSKLVSE